MKRLYKYGLNGGIGKITLPQNILYLPFVAGDERAWVLNLQFVKHSVCLLFGAVVSHTDLMVGCVKNTVRLRVDAAAPELGIQLIDDTLCLCTGTFARKRTQLNAVGVHLLHLFPRLHV